MRLLNRRQRYTLYKFWYLLSLVRWYSILAIMVAQYLAAIFLLNQGASKLDLIQDVNLHLSIFATAFVIASGFIINSFYDLERDTINRPDRVIFSRLVSQTTCLNFYFFFNTVGVVASFYVSKRVMLFNFLFSVALWFYSHKLKKKAFWGELSAATLTLAPFFVVIIYYNSFSFDLFLYLSFISLIVLIREVVKDILSEKGDLIFGYQTLPIKIGTNGAKKVIAFLMFLTIVPYSIIYFKQGFNWVLGYFTLGEIMLVVIAYFLYRAQSIQDFERLNSAYKLILTLGVLSIPLV